ncbi:hypothetical protein GQ54DRAFT_297374 [Martensiomyces pterosporus]|nr:hypothetical protein GQ54DRAFT_297374 [Martensiomyces pterosporus]
MEPSDIVLLILAVICPPGSVALKRGLSRDFIICVGLTLLFWVPGIAYSWYLIFRYPLENFRRRGNNAQYQTIEEGLRRQSMNISLMSDEDASSTYRSGEEDDSRSATMTSDSVMPPQSSLKPQAGRSKRPHRSHKSRGSGGGGGGRKSTSNGGSAGRRSSSGNRPSQALQEAARNYAMRHHQRQRSNSVKRWFKDRFYFPDPTQVPPSLEETRDESHELGASR